MRQRAVFSKKWIGSRVSQKISKLAVSEVSMALLILGAFTSLIWWGVASGRERRRKEWDEARNFKPPNALGQTIWANLQELRAGGLLNWSGIFFGFAPDGRHKLRLKKPGNILLVAAARAGKFVTVLAALVMSLPRRAGCLLVDPKAEMTVVCSGALLNRGKVYVLNAYGLASEHMTGLQIARINPEDDIDPNSPQFISDCLALPATWWGDASESPEPHWLESSQPLFGGIIYWNKKYAPPENQNLPYCRQILTGATGQSFWAWCRMVMRLNDEFLTGVFSRYAERGAEESREYASVWSTALTQTAWLDDSQIADSLKCADVSLGHVKKPGITISVIDPSTRTGDGRFSAMVFGWTAHLVLNKGMGGDRTPSVFVVDEASSLGKRNLKIWNHLLSAGAGSADLRLILTYQNVAQIKRQFGGENALSTVLQSCALSIWFACRNHEDRQVVSDLAGTTEVVTRTRSVSLDRRNNLPNVSDSAAQTARPFITPAEVGRLEPNEMICFCESVKNPIKAIRKPYTQICRGFRPNPYYQPGGLFRRLFQ
jgi:type IV secretory pathway TraG/TraD family ATPase VirD4